MKYQGPDNHRPAVEPRKEISKFYFEPSGILVLDYQGEKNAIYAGTLISTRHGLAARESSVSNHIRMHPWLDGPDWGDDSYRL